MADAASPPAPSVPVDDEPAASRCLNCGAVLNGPFCARCGQAASENMLSMRHLFRHVVSDFLSLDARYVRTLIPLVTRPGLLTREYVAGRRVRYVPPVRLYLATSFVLFFVLAVMSSGVFQLSRDDAAPSAAADTTAAASDAQGTPFRKDLTGASSRNSGFRFELFGTRATEKNLDSLVAARPIIGRVARGTQRAASDPERFVQAALDRIPLMMFLLIPVFALALKLLYVRSGRLYAAHFVFALHTQSFTFLVVLLIALIMAFVPSWHLENLTVVASGIYLFFAMRRFYGQSRLLTFTKLLLLLSINVVTIVIGLSVVMYISLLFV